MIFNLFQGGLIPLIEAAKKKADLIYIATHGRTGLSHALMGNVAEKVVGQAPCQVLTVTPMGGLPA